MPSNYDNAALFYDQLSRMVFGRALLNSQLYLLQSVPPNSSVLIVGGGTGWILQELSTIHYSGLNITYVELSSRMLTLAQKRNTGINKVTFINNAVENITLNQQFDVVITPFILDSLTEESLEKVFSHIHGQLKPRGLWLFADFKPAGKLWQRALLKGMYFFFKLLCGIETTTLPQTDHQFLKRDYVPKAKKTFYGGFITSVRYQKL